LKSQNLRIAKDMFSKGTDIIIPDFKMYYKATVFKTVLLAKNQVNRNKEGRETRHID
jgi:hypothetical protein